MKKFYPDSKVELTPFLAKYYDETMNIMSLGLYDTFIHKVIKDCNFKPNKKILDLGAGTGKNAFIMQKFTGKTTEILGIDISDEMEKQFNKRFENFENVTFKKARIDRPLNITDKFDYVFISFVLHGFPHEIRKSIIQNAYNALKPGGTFNILDFSEFSLDDMPIYYKIPFTKIECKYAFDFIERNWKNILSDYGFGNFEEKFYFKNYVRLLIGEKIG